MAQWHRTGAALLAAAGEESWPTIPIVEKPPSNAVLASRCGVEYEQALQTYRGPFSKSNWVLPGRLLCGCAPHDYLHEICSAGITTFASLQCKSEADSYQNGVLKHCAHAKFISQPIADQQVTSDEQCALLVLQLLRRMHNGEVCYLHCRGGHGRTGTVCALLLGIVHRLDGPAALATYQALHDTRTQPCFASSDYEPGLEDSCCVALFPVQHEQVIRLLGSATDPAGPLELMPAPPLPQRALSEQYGHGASAYEPAVLEEWKVRGQRAAQAAKAQDWNTACEEFERCVHLRPDWDKGHKCLARASKKKSEAAAAACHGIAPLEEVTIATPMVVPQAKRGAAAVPPKFVGLNVPTLVLTVGLPGSGKTTFARALAKAGDWTVLDSDEIGGRTAVEDAIATACRPIRRAATGARGALAPQRVLIDRCHVRASDRQRVLEIVAPLLQDAAAPVALFFSADAATCIERVAKRTDHPSIPYGRGRAAVQSMAKALEVPAPPKSALGAEARSAGPIEAFDAEGFRWITLRTMEEANALLASWGSPPLEVAAPGFFKFPRTRHVLNAGGTAVTRDDLLMDASDAGRFFDGRTVVTAEEKVDGANLGFSLTRDYEIIAQNRSHTVNPESHSQFRPLAAWLAEHGWALCQLLKPEAEVLFGEWLAARHTVGYTHLPGYFVAFDIYDKRTGTFCSASERDRRMAGLGIPCVRRIARQAFHTKEELLSLLETQSAYGDGFVEGAYLRIDDDSTGRRNVARGKIVRPDFIQGIEEHWINQEMVRNTVRPDMWAEELELE